MINVFDIAANDQSIVYLSQIFGQMGTVLTGASVNLLATMFKTFNTIVLAVAALIVVYTVVVGLLATAAEGEFLGKKFHGLWTPIRTVLGIAALVPTASGYCALQILMMWVIIQGVGAADTVWSTALKYVSATGSPYAQPSVPGVGPEAGLAQAFQGLSCAATAGINQSMPEKPKGFNGYYCSNNRCNGSVVSQKCKGDTCQLSFGPKGACGSLSYCNVTKACSGSNSNSLTCKTCQSQTNVLTGNNTPFSGTQATSTLGGILGTLNLIAVQFAQADYDYQAFYYGSSVNANNNGYGWGWINNYCNAESIAPCCNPSSAAPSGIGLSGMCTGSAGADAFPTPSEDAALPMDASSDAVTNMILPYVITPKIGDVDFIAAGATSYTEALVGDAITAIDESDVTETLKTAQDYGWVFAGAYYYYIARQNDQNLEDTNPELTFTGAGPAASSSNPLRKYRNNFNAASRLTSATSVGSGSAPTPELGAIKNIVSSGSSTILNSFMKTVTGSNSGSVAKGGMAVDPLIKIQSLGKGILITVQILFPIILSLEVVAGVLSMISSLTVLGTGTAAGGTSLIVVLSALVTPLLLGFLGVFMGIGALLAVYTPLIPYIIFITGVIGWFGSTIEAMVAAPLVALGILAPGGHHEILGKAEPALMLLFGIFLRPTLMIFGLMAGMLMATVAVTIINASFGAVMGTIAGGKSGKGVVDFLSLIFFMVAYVSLVLAALNKCFAMIHIIPNNVMRWIGGTGQDYGEGEVLSETKGAVGGAAGQAAGAAGGAASAGRSASKERGQIAKDAQEKAEHRRKLEEGKLSDSDKPK